MNIEKITGTNHELSLEDLETIKKIPGFSFQKNFSTRVRRFNNTLVVLTHGRSACGDYDIYSGDWDYPYSVGLISADFSKAVNLGSFPLKYTTVWPIKNTVQTMYEEEIQEIYIEGQKLYIVLTQKVYGKKYWSYQKWKGQCFMEETFSATSEPSRVSTKTLLFDIPGDFVL